MTSVASTIAGSAGFQPACFAVATTRRRDAGAPKRIERRIWRLDFALLPTLHWGGRCSGGGGRFLNETPLKCVKVAVSLKRHA